MKKLLLVTFVLLTGCTKFDPKLDPDVGLIVNAINEDRKILREVVEATNVLIYQSETKKPGEFKKFRAKFIEERKKADEGKS